MSKKADKTQVAVIGGGPGGYPAAFHAADLGLQVTLIDEAPHPGGVCLYRGCIPSKALLHVAAVINESKASEAFGLTFSGMDLDVDKLRSWKQSVVDKLTGGLGGLSKQRNVNFLQGRAQLLDAHKLAVATAGGEQQELSFEYAIVASGSSPATIPVTLDSPRVLDSTGALELPDIPAKLLVVGGGYIGLELGQAYAAFGSEVSVVEMLPSLLANADKDLVRVLAQRLKKQFAAIMLDTKLAGMEETGEAIKVTFEDKNGEKSEAVYDRVLAAVGRKPNSAGLGLEHTGAVVDEQGFIATDAQRRTAEPSLFAIGDVAGQPMLAHKATYEGKVAAEVIAGRKTVFDARAIPAVVFTDPEIAWCGVSETEAGERGLKVKVAKFPWGASGRAATLGRADGVTKIIADSESERVLGVGIAGPGAGELIAEGTLAIEMGATAGDLALTIHAHPTLSETAMEAAEALTGHSIHFYTKKK